MDVARSELRRGQPDGLARRKLEALYTKNRIGGLIEMIIAHRLAEDIPAARNLGVSSFDDPQFVQWAVTRYRELDDAQPEFTVKGEKDPLRERIGTILLRKMIRLSFIFYSEGETAARTFCEQTIVPLLVDRQLIDWYVRRIRILDGLTKHVHK